MLLILTASGDVTASYLAERLASAGLPFLRVDTDTITTCGSITYRLPTPRLRIDDIEVAPDAVTNVWLRRPRPIRVDIAGDEAERVHVANEWGEAAEGFLAHIPPERWMNHPTANVRASHKLEQLTRASARGLHVPDTLVTASRDELARFWERHAGRVVAKPIASGYLERPDGRMSAIYTTRVLGEHLEDAPLAACPTLFQEEVAKAHDVRVTVVDDAMTAVAMHRDVDGTQIVDIRRDNMERVRYTCCDIPDGVRRVLRELLRSYDLRFAAVDFAVTPAGQWIFFEINPNGQWAWLDLAGVTELWKDFAHAFSA
jgi:glutathione synthase/RimK-type ligase-like ATP-grasp enzyme